MFVCTGDRTPYCRARRSLRIGSEVRADDSSDVACDLADAASASVAVALLFPVLVMSFSRSRLEARP